MNTEQKLPTEQEMREQKALRPKSIDELANHIKSLTERDHDYGTCVYAMSLAATAAFNYVASQLGVTGYQASCADLDILRRTRSIDCPFALFKAEKMLYPQYDLKRDLDEMLEEWKAWAAKEARKKLNEINPEFPPHPDVKARWEELANYV